MLISVLQGFLALAFFAAGAAKLAGVQKMRDEFARWGYPGWFRPFTGAYEVLAAVLLVVGFWEPLGAAAGAAMLVVAMGGAVLTHVRAGDPPQASVPAAVLGAMAAVVLVARWPL